MTTDCAEAALPACARDRLRVFPGVVSAEACAKIAKRGDDLILEPGSLHDNASGGRYYDEDVRLTSVGWLHERDWIFNLVHGYASRVNAEWGFDLTDAQALQYAVYRRLDFFNWHKDMLRVRQGPIRKISVVVQLSPPEAYSGGRLEFIDPDFGTLAPPGFEAQGSTVVFSSLLRHRVTPIKAGERRSLTGWFMGPPFR